LRCDCDAEFLCAFSRFQALFCACRPAMLCSGSRPQCPLPARRCATRPDIIHGARAQLPLHWCYRGDGRNGASGPPPLPVDAPAHRRCCCHARNRAHNGRIQRHSVRLWCAHPSRSPDRGGRQHRSPLLVMLLLFRRRRRRPSGLRTPRQRRATMPELQPGPPLLHRTPMSPSPRMPPPPPRLSAMTSIW
jgi:hypothetical protein